MRQISAEFIVFCLLNLSVASVFSSLNDPYETLEKYVVPAFEKNLDGSIIVIDNHHQESAFIDSFANGTLATDISAENYESTYYPSEMQAFASSFTVPVCPRATVLVESEWYAGVQLRVILDYEDEGTYWNLELDADNLIAITSGWKVNNRKTSENTFEFELKSGVLTGKNTFYFTAEKTHWHRDFRINTLKINYNWGKKQTLCKAIFASIDNPKDVLSRSLISEDTGETPPVFINCLPEFNKPVGVGWYSFCLIKKSKKISCDGLLNQYNQQQAPFGKFIQISSYDYHTCALSEEGLVQCWGASYVDIQNYLTVIVDPPKHLMATISAGGLHACGLSVEGDTTCWGRNDYDQTNSQGGKFSQISAGYRHSCAIANEDQKLSCWGNCEFNECTPKHRGKFLKVSCGNKFTCGVKENDEIECWGLNSTGILNYPEGSFKSVTVSSGQHAFACAVRQNGTVLCWGQSEILKNHPAQDVRFQSISLGGIHACGAMMDDRLFCWGSSDLTSGNMYKCNDKKYCFTPSDSYTSWNLTEVDNNSTQIPSTTPNNESPHLTPAPTLLPEGPNFELGDQFLKTSLFRFRKQAAVGNGYSCGIHEDGTAECWGLNWLVHVASKQPKDLLQISASTKHPALCSLKLDGSLDCWAATNDGYGNFISPIFVPPSERFVQVSTYNMHSCGVLTNTRIKCWGYNDFKQCSPPNFNYLYVSVGGHHTCAITIFYKVVCWGRNNYGQATVPNDYKYRFVSSGHEHTCALGFNGKMVCWGRNNYNQLEIPEDSWYFYVSSGKHYTCAVLKVGRKLLCWGKNHMGQADAPPNAFYSVSAGISHTCGTTSQGRMKCWGENTNGQTNVPSKLKERYSSDMYYYKRDRVAQCSEWGWLLHSQKRVCVYNSGELSDPVRKLPSIVCPEPMPFVNASVYCAKLGGRLPTVDELVHGIPDSNLCTDESSTLWTLTNCISGMSSGNYLGTMRYDTKSAYHVECSVTSTTLAHPVCVADADYNVCDLGNECQQVCLPINHESYACSCHDHFTLASDGVTCTADAVQQSAATCNQLRWDSSFGDPELCIPTNMKDYSMCGSASNYLLASSHCTERRMRLPTRQEVLNSDLVGHICTTGNSHIWTSTACQIRNATLGRIALVNDPETHHEQEICMEEQDVAHAICIADFDVDECALGIDDCSELCKNLEGSYACTCTEGRTLDVDSGLCTEADERVSENSCGQLRWREMQQQRNRNHQLVVRTPQSEEDYSMQVCTSRAWRDKGCDKNVVLEEALNLCESMGARLPSLREVSRLEFKRNACRIRSGYIWTSNTCSIDGKEGLIVSSLTTTRHENPDRFTCLMANDTANSICVADKDENECQEGLGKECSGICKDLTAGFFCQCEAGEFLSTNGLSCLGATELQEMGHPTKEVSKVSCSKHRRWSRHFHRKICATGRHLYIDDPKRVCRPSMNFTEARELCKSVGARLPTYEEASARGALDYSCRLPRKHIWTSTQCFERGGANEPLGSIKTAGSSWGKRHAPTECASRETGQAYVVCVADFGFDECEAGKNNCSQTCIDEDRGYSCTCEKGYTLSEEDHTTCVMKEVEEESYLSCSELDFRPSRRVRNLCHKADVFKTAEHKLQEQELELAGSCGRAVDFRTAKKICEDLGARLPRYDEVMAGVSQTRSCFREHTRIWTSTNCSSSTGGVSGAITMNGFRWKRDKYRTQCSPFEEEHGFVQCVADKAGDPCAESGTDRCSEQRECFGTSMAWETEDGRRVRYSCACKDGMEENSEGRCSLLTQRFSGSTCGDLKWRSDYGSNRVCVSGQVRLKDQPWGAKAFECVNEQVTYEQAVAFCSGMEARLPTLKEVMADEARKNGRCHHNNGRIWTSSTCYHPFNSSISGIMTAPGASFRAKRIEQMCMDASTAVAFVMCVADSATDPCQDHDCDHHCVQHNREKKCACHDGFKLNEDGKTCGKIPQGDAFLAKQVKKSEKNCQDLNWRTSKADRQHCSNSQILPGELRGRKLPLCAGYQTYEKAFELCKFWGARLPTVDEVIKGVTARDRCNQRNRPIWTQTKCTSSKHGEELRVVPYGDLRYFRDQPHSCSTVSDTKLQHVICVADSES